MKMTAKTRAGCGLEDRMRFEILPEQKRIRSALCRQPMSREQAEQENSVHRTSRTHARIELDFAECAFVTGDVLLQESKQSLCLLRAQVDALEVADLDLGFGLLLQRAEDEQEIQDVHTHLHLIGIFLLVVRDIFQL